jgi:hypothetical protein
MSSNPYLQSIFYPCRKYDTINALSDLASYQFTTTYLQKFRQRNAAEPAVVPSPATDYTPPSIGNITVKETVDSPATEHPEESVYYPQKENSLFWSIYILAHGINDYLNIGQKYGNRELEEKQRMIDAIKKHPTSLKQLNHRVTNVMIQEILSELMIQKKSSLLSFMAMVVYYQKNVYILKGKTYLKFFANQDWDLTDSDDFDHFVILRYDEEEDRYGIDWEVSVKKIAEIERERIELESIEKPLRGISAFKVSDLEQLASLLWRDTALEEAVSLNKPDLYQKIYDACIWNTGLSLQKKGKRTNKSKESTKPPKN